MLSVMTILCLIALITLYGIWYYRKVGRMRHYLRKCPGFETYPFVGNIPTMLGGYFRMIPDDFSVLILAGIYGVSKAFDEFFVFWLGWRPMIIVYKPHLVEQVLSSNKLIEKSYNYDLLHPWLGRGLLTNVGDSWRARRKLLTPAFHFKIIDDFIPIIGEHSMHLVEKVKNTKGATVELSPLITACTLDIICDTAMGLKINAQNDSDSDYVKSVYILGESFMYRTLEPVGWIDFIFYRTQYGKEYLKSLRILHNFTRRVIRERKTEMQKRMTEGSLDQSEDALGRKKRRAFLDLLLEHHLQNSSELSEEDIREEVDTFMFEGHDTTAMAISWSLFMIGLDKEVQSKIHLEIDSVFGDDKSRPITASDLPHLKYLEACIKEALRLFPSVPAIARLVNEDFELGTHFIPKGATLLIFPYGLHRNEEVFPQPEVYKPERFLSENVSSETKINPYAYVPFSAGPRNCIGQRFALTEEKIVLANLFRNFNVMARVHRDQVRVAMELVTRPKEPILVSFQPR